MIVVSCIILFSELVTSLLLQVIDRHLLWKTYLLLYVIALHLLLGKTHWHLLLWKTYWHLLLHSTARQLL